MSRHGTNIVAVTMRLAPAPGYLEERDAISHDWLRLLSGLGLTPILVPNLSRDPESLLSQTGVSRILLTNGDSLGPLPGEPNGPAPTVRDQLEYRLMDYAVRERVPVLGVCRGLQLINAYFGGRISRKLAHDSGEQHVACSHQVFIKPGDAPLEVNSYHDEGVMASQLAAPLKITALSAAQVVEGLVHPTLPIWAIQWHPERHSSHSSVETALLRQWMDA